MSNFHSLRELRQALSRLQERRAGGFVEVPRGVLGPIGTPRETVGTIRILTRLSRMGDTDQLIANMRARIQQARRLAKSTLDREVADLLLKMAADGEADVRRLEAERDAAQTSGARRQE